jgi:trk system potassium uptake protein TrkA
MYIVIAGDDEIAFRVAEGLMERHEVVFIGDANASRARMERLDVELIIGEPTARPILEAASVRRSDFFVACTESDERNIVSCLAAKRMGAKRTVCFLHRPGFFSMDTELGALEESLGLDHVVRPQQQLAEEIVRIVLEPGALDVQTYSGGLIRVLKSEVEDSAPIAQAPLKDLRLPKGVVLVMGRRGDDFFIPRGDTRFEPGDKITLTGSMGSIRRFRAHLLKPRTKLREARRATVVGCGVVGLAVTRELEDAGWNVTVIEVSAARCEEATRHVKRSLIINGDGSDLTVLEEEHVADNPVLIAVTSNDEKNLLVSLLGKHLGIDRIITRADRLVNEKMFEKVGIDVVLSARGAAVRSVIREIVEGDSERLGELEHGDVRVLELELGSDFPEIHLRDLRVPLFAIVGAILRKSRAYFPGGADMLGPGDHVIVFCKSDEEESVRRFFCDYRAPADRRKG